jgi:hypothetical protein
VAGAVVFTIRGGQRGEIEIPITEERIKEKLLFNFFTLP